MKKFILGLAVVFLVATHFLYAEEFIYIDGVGSGVSGGGGACASSYELGYNGGDTANDGFSSGSAYGVCVAIKVTALNCNMNNPNWLSLVDSLENGVYNGKLVIASHNSGSDQPDTFLYVDTYGGTAVTSTDWSDAEAITASLSNGTTYWLIFVADTASTYLRYDTGSARSYRFDLDSGDYGTLFDVSDTWADAISGKSPTLATDREYQVYLVQP